MSVAVVFIIPTAFIAPASAQFIDTACSSTIDSSGRLRIDDWVGFLEPQALQLSPTGGALDIPSAEGLSLRVEYPAPRSTDRRFFAFARFGPQLREAAPFVHLPSQYTVLAVGAFYNYYHGLLFDSAVRMTMTFRRALPPDAGSTILWFRDDERNPEVDLSATVSGTSIWWTVPGADFQACNAFVVVVPHGP